MSYRALSAEDRTYTIWFAFTVGDSCPRPLKTSLFIRRPAAGWGCTIILQTTSEGGCQGGEPSPNPAPHPHKTLGHKPSAWPKMPTRAACLQIIVKTHPSSSDTYVGTGIITMLCGKKIRLNGEWLPQMTIISSAFMQPKQTLSYCPSSLVSSLKGQLDSCPMPRHHS